LIIYRLAEGRAWNRGSFANESKLATLQFAGTTEMTTASNLETPMDGVPLGMPFKFHSSTDPIVISNPGKEEMRVNVLPY
jgi:hypothetical protein